MIYEIVKLGSVIDVVMGQAPPGSKCNKEGIGIPFVKAGEFSKISPSIREWTTEPKKFGEQGDVFLCVVGATCGKINLGIDCAIGRSVAALRPNPCAIDKKYLYYFMSQMIQSLRRNSLGAAQTVISKEMINNIEIKLPPLTEQKQIVSKLDKTFSQIDKAINSSNKQILEVDNLRYDKIRSLMIDLGRKFGFAILNDVSKIQPKKKIALEKLDPNDEVSFLNMNGLGIEQKYSESSINKRLKEVYSSYQYFENNDVVFAKITPCFENGKLSIVKNLKNGTGFGSSEFVILRPKNLIDSEFLYYTLLDKSFRIKGKEQMSGAVGHKRVTKDYFYNYKIPTPPIEVQQKTVKILDKIWDNSDSFYLSKCKKSEELINLKSCILYHELQNNSK